jgi:hypothetical protein
VPALPLVPAALPPAPVLPPLPLPPVPPVPVVDVQRPPEQVMPPEHGALQPPQWVLLVFVSTQEVPHSIWPPEQPQTPLLQALAPVGQALQPPQWRIVLSPPFVTHEPPEHVICPVGQLPVMHWLLLQTWPDAQALQPPQCCASEPTQEPLQRNRPVEQVHWPFSQARPAPQALPHAPQFEVSVASVLHWPLQFVMPEEQLTPEPPVPLGGPLSVGFAQLAASSRQPRARALRRAEGERGRVFIRFTSKVIV